MSTDLAGGDSRPALEDPQGENQWTQLARKHWIKPTKTRKVKSDVIKKEIWDVLENEGFEFRSLLILESLQLLEKSGILRFLARTIANTSQLPLAWLYRQLHQPPCPPNRNHRNGQESRKPSCLG